MLVLLAQWRQRLEDPGALWLAGRPSLLGKCSGLLFVAKNSSDKERAYATLHFQVTAHY